jgi:hypothetical protein
MTQDEKVFAPAAPSTDLKALGVRTIEVASADGAQINAAILQPAEGSGVSLVLKHKGGGR